MIRDVDLTMYLPEFMQKYKEPVAALEAENPEFRIVWDEVNGILYNHFISTANEYGISRYEKLLGIFPSPQDTLESRRSRVQNKWFQQLPYTIRLFVQKLAMLCGNGSFTVTNNFSEGYHVSIKTILELYGQVEEVESLINIMFPVNIVVNSANSIACHASGAVLFGGGMVYVNSFMLTNDHQENINVRGMTATTGGVIQADSFLITNDYKEAFNINGITAAYGGVVRTDSFVITNDFQEDYQSRGGAKAASGAVYVDFFEID